MPASGYRGVSPTAGWLASDLPIDEVSVARGRRYAAWYCWPRRGHNRERKQEEYSILRQDRILKGINRIFGIVVQDQTEEDLGNECLSVALEVIGSKLGFVNLVGDDKLCTILRSVKWAWSSV